MSRRQWSGPSEERFPRDDRYDRASGRSSQTDMIREYAKGTPRPLTQEDIDSYEVVGVVDFFGFISDFYDLLEAGALDKVERIMGMAPRSFEKRITATADGVNMYFIIEKTK